MTSLFVTPLPLNNNSNIPPLGTLSQNYGLMGQIRIKCKINQHYTQLLCTPKKPGVPAELH